MTRNNVSWDVFAFNHRAGAGPREQHYSTNQRRRRGGGGHNLYIRDQVDWTWSSKCDDKQGPFSFLTN